MNDSKPRDRLDLPVLLPDVPDVRDDCVVRLTTSLQDREGIHRAHVLDATDGEPAQLCLHYDPDVVSLPRIRQIARSVGAELTDRYGHAVWGVEGVRHPRHARTIAERLRRMDGVLEADVAASGQVRLEYDQSVLDEETVRERIGGLGLRVVERERGASEKPSRSGDEERGARGDRDKENFWDVVTGMRTELVFALVSGGCVAVGFGLAWVDLVPEWVSIGLYIGSYVFGGYHTAREAIDSVRVGRFEVDALMLVAAVGAASLGRWAEGAFLLFLFSLGHALEHYAMDRAHEAIESLADLAPSTARVRRNGQEVDIPVEEVMPGDAVLVRPNERIPADGVVVQGKSEVNQAPVTGESVPVEKRPVEEAASPDGLDSVDSAHRLFAGTINGSGALEMRVTRQSDETTLARVVEMVTEAETEKSPTQHFTDRFERYFVPSVLAFVGVLLFAWVPLEESFAESFYRAMAVLVAASPCALAIATPSAVLSGIARAARGGVLVKGGGPLENLGMIEVLAFDKTGTVTEGMPEVTEVRPLDGVAVAELLRTAVAVEQHSDHPLAEAVVRYGRRHLETHASVSVDEVQSKAGRGIDAVVDGVAVAIGRDALFTERDGTSLPAPVRGLVDELEAEGRTTMIVRKGDRFLGVIGLMDEPREGVRATLDRLRTLGIQRMILISGDNQQVAAAVADELGIDEVRGDLQPDKKVDAVRALRKEGPVAMVGDGVNDAPAMANATVGIAMGAAGSDVALETAEVALMADRLDHLPFALGLSRQTRRVIKQNLWLALGMIAVLVPATILGLNIGPAVVLHEGSTLLVVANALRLLGYSTPDEPVGLTA